MKPDGIQFGRLPLARSLETRNTSFPPLGIRDPLQAWRHLPFSTLELMSVTVVPKPTAGKWLQIVESEEGIWVPGGTFSGPLLNGAVVHTTVKGSYDPSGLCIDILAKVKMRTDDGVIVQKTNRGRWLGTNNAVERIVRGAEVAASEYYLIGILEYSVSAPSYAWLEQGQYLTRGVAEGDLLHVADFRVVPGGLNQPAD